MVIFVGGLIGTGKTSIAKALAEKLGIVHYDIDEAKKEIYPQDPDYEHNLKNSIPFSDETRVKTFERAVEEFEKLSSNNKHIVADETLHKEKLRQILFDGADKFFGGHLIIWVKVDEDKIKKRLESKERKGHVLKDPFGMYLSFKKQFEDFDHVDIEITNNGTLEETVSDLAERVKEKLQ